MATQPPALGGVVIQRDARVVEAARQSGPGARHVRDRLAEAAFGERALLMRPRADRLDDRRRLLPSQPGAQGAGRSPARAAGPRRLRATGLQPSGHNGFHDLEPGP